ncbi:hypothetical protein [Parapedobacter soli]|uniref:hypothetical protein n=1 Tax=Parapedobacter soli TaxID=416955 RepID=UPI0021C634C3|nr:hypothetical protein [Parapedobacter soli]
MEKIAVVKLVEFNRKKPKGQKTLVDKMKIPQPINPDGGGDYWISALSSIASSFQLADSGPIAEKIDILIDKIENASTKQVKNMFQANLNILNHYENFDFASIRPNARLTFLKKPKAQSIVEIKGLPIYAKPSHVYTYEENGKKRIGAMWFVAKLNGFRPNELPLFTDILFRYLNVNYGDKFQIDERQCIAVDVITTNNISYSQILSGEVESSLLATITAIKKLI